MGDYNPRKASNSLNFLHPKMRSAVEAVLKRTGESEVPFRVFESYRSPERQHYLYYQKKPRPTKARPWRSRHQYGLAVDFVIDREGVGWWSTKTPEHREWWNLLHEAGRQEGLEPLSWEKPHLQLAGIKLSDLRKGVFPPGGDDPWVLNIQKAMDRYPRGSPKAPPEYEDDILWCRPWTNDGLELY